MWFARIQCPTLVSEALKSKLEKKWILVNIWRHQELDEQLSSVSEFTQLQVRVKRFLGAFCQWDAVIQLLSTADKRNRFSVLDILLLVSKLSCNCQQHSNLISLKVTSAQSLLMWINTAHCSKWHILPPTAAITTPATSALIHSSAQTQIKFNWTAILFS